ncbi:MAG: argininosuccinate lyase [Deltaproteobacteria bacterium]|nr:argininosuccinate lyase [Deltaproteobacteria bacterium]
MAKVAKGEHYRKKGARLMEEADEAVLLHKPGVPEDYRYLLNAFHLIDKAHLIMLVEEGLIPRQDGVTMLRVLKEMEREGVEEVRLRTGGAMHSGEHFLIETLGEEIGGRLHLGRSSGDMQSTSGRLLVRSGYLALMTEVLKFRAGLLEMARNHVDTVMPHYTRFQHGQTTTFGHYLVAVARALERDFERLAQAFARCNESSMGCGAGTGSEFPLNRKRTAELMGFSSVNTNTKDSYAFLDFGIEAYTVMSILMTNIDRTATDIFVWYTHEFGLIDLADRYCGTSSIMAQKKNPHGLMYVTDNISKLLGRMTGAIIQYRNISGIGVLKELGATFQTTLRSVRAMAGIITTMKVKSGRMRELATAFWAQASDLAGAIVREKGLPWRTAYQIVAILVRQSIEEGKGEADVTPEMLDRAAVEYTGKPLGLGAAVIQKALDSLECVRARKLIGGPAPEEVERQIAESRQKLLRDNKIFEELEAQIKAGEKKLEEAERALM